MFIFHACDILGTRQLWYHQYKCLPMQTACKQLEHTGNEYTTDNVFIDDK